LIFFEELLKLNPWTSSSHFFITHLPIIGSILGAGYLGGKIRHTEIDVTTTYQEPEKHEDDD
jgi:hypothetical protein